MHAGGFEALEGGFGLGGEVGHEASGAVRDRDRRHAVGEDVDLADERRVAGGDVVEEVVDGGLDAVACGLAGDDDGVGVHELLEEAGVPLGEGGAVVTGEDFGAEDAVVLGERMAALHFAPRLGAAGEAVEQARFVDVAGEGVTGGSEEAVRGPEVEGILALAFELLGVVDDLLEEPGVVAATKPPGHRRVRTDGTGLDLGGGDDAEGGEGSASAIDPE